MSGGVDSSTTAAILKSEGHDVVGVTLVLCNQQPNQISQNVIDAQSIAAYIQIPHHTINCEASFQRKVIDYFINKYINGETPLPCAVCNRDIKLATLLEFAKSIGATSIATGHYARKIIKDGENQLHTAIDLSKDQSYFLFSITPEQLKYVTFPLGSIKKTRTRALAIEYGLHVADKKESQDICFVPNNDYKTLIQKHIPQSFCDGNFVLSDGTIIGKHRGISNYTIGQRRGIGIAYNQPLYVTKIDSIKNEVTVGIQSDLKARSVMVTGINWLTANPPAENIKFQAHVKLRSTHKGSVGIVTPLQNGKLSIHIEEEYLGVTPGQACVIYDDSRVLGGGWIAKE